MTKTSAELEREVEDARGRIDQTVEALKDKMQPREMFDEATKMMGGASNKVLTTAVDQLRENPIPIALIGLGVAWLAISQTRSRSAGGDYQASGYYPTYEGYDEDEGLRAKVKAKAEAAKAKLAETAEKAKARLADAQHHAADGVTSARGKAGEYAHLAQEKAGEYGRAARQRFDETLDHEPLVIGAIGLAVGAAIGASLPSTPVERRYIGPARNKVADRAKASIGEVKDVAQRAYGQVKDELHRQTGPAGEGATLREKASAIAEAGARTVKDELEGRAH
ncbi:MAG: DUF3618 domain-containing protein [Phenylobacterium sp.]|uniref:DUF3618 domain-containing protein n=1 Tax=Phenylobacterium sp. TaxID=1871053 RepID=UPI0012017615|nr:DUF3618 domain-containing protein [Phenylobacterium sp.]TAJ74794.1 MAG: DUF3618 domain-containing protein [Phenylobacterium sp.]